MPNPYIRPRLNLCGAWDYSARREARAWLRGHGGHGEAVHLPHGWNRHDTFQRGVTYRRGWGSYRVALDGDALNGAYRWRLRSEGFYGFGDVWSDGRRLARVDGQYLGLKVDLPDSVATEGRHVFAVRLCNGYRRNVLPGIADPDFLLYGGLAGRAWLEGVGDAYFEEDATVIQVEGFSAEDGLLRVEGVLRRRAGSWSRARVRCEVFDADGRAAAAEERDIAVRGDSPATAFGPWRLRVPNVRRWSTTEPNLYTVRLTLLEARGVLDGQERRVGFREAEFRPREGFFLNGSRLPLRGCNRHACMPGMGQALHPALHRLDAERMRSMGLNFVRLSHYPQHPAFLDACDELGLLVYAELASWKRVRRGAWLRAACRQMRGLVARDRHRPSVILWGLGNEARSRPVYRTLYRLVRELDATRAITYAENHLHRARRARTPGIPDVWALNYEFEALDAACEAARLKVAVVSECSNSPHAARGVLAAEAEQVERIAADLARLDGRPAVAGFALWSFNDYATMRKGRYYRECGLVDAWREPKMSAAWLRARFGAAPFVRLFADWSLSDDSDARDVHVVAGDGATVLLVNGRRVASWKGGGHWHCRVRFEPGELRAVVTAATGAEAEARLLSYGTAMALAPAGERLGADCCGRELYRVVVRVLDVDRRPVLTDARAVTVRATGDAVIRSHRVDGRIPVSGGLGVVYVEVRSLETPVVVAAEADGLQTGVLTIAGGGPR